MNNLKTRVQSILSNGSIPKKNARFDPIFFDAHIPVNPPLTSFTSLYRPEIG